MDTAQPSFIPRDAKESRRGGRSNAGLSELLLLIAVVLFVASAALAGGVFLYGQYLNTSNASKLSQLQRAEAAFEPSLVQQLQRLDDRMNAANQLLQVHLAPLALFSMLEQTTISSIQFTSLQFDATDRAHITLKMSGVADSVNSVALQSDLFSKSGAIQSPIFSNIDRQVDGVHFDFASLVNPTALNFAQLVTGQASANQIPTQSTTNTQGTSAAQTTPTAQPQQTQNANPFSAQGSASSSSSTSPAGQQTH